QGGPGLKYAGSATAVLDVNRDGLPDIVQTWPQNVQLGHAGASTWDECPNSGPGSCPAAGSTSKVMYWFMVAKNVSGFGDDPQLVCTNEGFQGPDEAPCVVRLRSARENIAYVNKGVGVGGTISLQHHCLDAGDGSAGTLTEFLVNNADQRS